MGSARRTWSSHFVNTPPAGLDVRGKCLESQAAVKVTGMAINLIAHFEFLLNTCLVE